MPTRRRPSGSRLNRFSPLVVSLLIVSCGGGGSGSNDPTQVQTPRATSISLSSSTVTVDGIGTTYQFTATVRDQNGQTMSSASVNWSSSNTGVVTINSAGLATAVAAGTATISVTSGTASASASLVVTPTLSSAKELLSFGFLGAHNTALAEDMFGQIVGNDVTILIPSITDATQMIASFTVSPGATVEVDGIGQVDGVTGNDFTNVIRYTISAEDQSSTNFTIYLGRLLAGGEVTGWQRTAGAFKYFSDPRDIMLLESIRVHLDSTFTLIGDTLHATITDTISLYVYPTQAALHAWEKTLGWDPQDWAIGTAIGSDLIAVVSSNSTDFNMSFADMLSLVTHESTHSLVASFGTDVPIWLNEGLASTGEGLLAACFPDCVQNWDYHKSVIAATGKPDLRTMFNNPSAGYAFSVTTVLFIIKKYGWGALRTFLAAPTDYSVFGLADSDAFEVQWYAFLDELWGWVDPGQVPVVTIADARATTDTQTSVEGTVTWQPSWNNQLYFLQDGSAGIFVWQEFGAVSLSEGDQVRVVGKVGSYRGKVQLESVSDLSILGQIAVPAPRIVTGAEINEEEYQAQLVEITGTIQVVAELAYGNLRITIRDAAGTDFPVWVDARTGMTTQDWPAVGTSVRVRGVLGMDNRSGIPEGTGPRIEVRRKADVAATS